MDAQGKRALVHFNGWSPKFDTWIPFANLKAETKKEAAKTPAPVRVTLASVDAHLAQLSVVAGEGASKHDGSRELQQYQFKVDGEVRPVQRFGPPPRDAKGKGGAASGDGAEVWTCVLEDPFDDLDEPGRSVTVSLRVKAARHAFGDWVDPVQLSSPVHAVCPPAAAVEAPAKVPPRSGGGGGGRGGAFGGGSGRGSAFGSPSMPLGGSPLQGSKLSRDLVDEQVVLPSLPPPSLSEKDSVLVKTRRDRLARRGFGG